MFWPPPNIKPFKRLRVADGLLMNSERWNLAHDYHRMRLNAQYQSLNQPGIVSDMGVCAIPAPTDVPDEYRDDRWLQIQPGIAIDLFGNFIVVNEPVNFRIVSEALGAEPLTVYLAIAYVDPDRLEPQNNGDGEIVTEAFQIVERVEPPTDTDLELCRILLKPGKIQLANARDPFSPDFNQIDLRYRSLARARARAIVRVAELAPKNSQSNESNLSFLLQSVEGLYPPMMAADDIGRVSLRKEEKDNLLAFDLVYTDFAESANLAEQELEILEEYLQAGGVVLVEVPIAGTKLEEPLAVQQQLQKAIARYKAKLDKGSSEVLNSQVLSSEVPSSEVPGSEDEETAELLQSLQEEKVAIDEFLDKQIQELLLVFNELAGQLGTSLENLNRLSRNHPLRSQPFLFAALPKVNGRPVAIFTGGGMVIIIGELSSAWGLDEYLELPRETIRTAQELGINILHFAWRRRQMTKLARVRQELRS